MPEFKVTVVQSDDSEVVFETTVTAKSLPLAVFEFAVRVMHAHRELYLQHQREQDAKREREHAKRARDNLKR